MRRDPVATAPGTDLIAISNLKVELRTQIGVVADNLSPALVLAYERVPKPEFIEDPDRLCALAPVTQAPIRHHVFVCTGVSCSAVGSAEVKEAFERELTVRGLLMGKAAKGKNPQGSVVLTECASVGFCAIGAAVLVYPDGVWYAQVRASDVPEIIQEHLLNGRVVARLALMKVPVDTPAKHTDLPENENWEA